MLCTNTVHLLYSQAPTLLKDLNVGKCNHTSLNFEPALESLHSLFHSLFLTVQLFSCFSYKKLKGSPASGFTCRGGGGGALWDKETFSWCWTHMGLWVVNNALEKIFALWWSMVGFALLCSGLSLSLQVSDRSEGTQQENVLWSFLQQPNRWCCYSGNAVLAVGFSVVPGGFCTFVSTFSQWELQHMVWYKTRSRNHSDSIFSTLIREYKAVNTTITVRLLFHYILILKNILITILHAQSFIRV